MLSKLRWPSPAPHRQLVRSLASRAGSRPSASSTTRSSQPITHLSTSTTEPSPAETASRTSTTGSSQSPTGSSRPSTGRDEVEDGTRETFLWPSGLVPDCPGHRWGYLARAGLEGPMDTTRSVILSLVLTLDIIVTPLDA